MPRRARTLRRIPFRRGKNYRASARSIYYKGARRPGIHYKRVQRGLYVRPYNATKWVRMMRSQDWKKRIRGKYGRKRNFGKLFDSYWKQPSAIRNKIASFLGNPKYGIRSLINASW